MWFLEVSTKLLLGSWSGHERDQSHMVSKAAAESPPARLPLHDVSIALLKSPLDSLTVISNACTPFVKSVTRPSIMYPGRRTPAPLATRGASVGLCGSAQIRSVVAPLAARRTPPCRYPHPCTRCTRGSARWRGRWGWTAGSARDPVQGRRGRRRSRWRRSRAGQGVRKTRAIEWPRQRRPVVRWRSSMGACCSLVHRRRGRWQPCPHVVVVWSIGGDRPACVFLCLVYIASIYMLPDVG